MEIDQELLSKIQVENKEFSNLYQEHDSLKGRVDKLNRMKFLTPAQEIEKKKIQKQKLKNKDRMIEIVNDYKIDTH